MIALASDHAGYALKKELEEYLVSKGYETKDFGTYSEESCDYAVYGYRACRAVTDGECDRALLICGTGIGMSLAANKVKGIRCVVCSEPFSAKLSRNHNDSNVLSLGVGPVITGCGFGRDVLVAFPLLRLNQSIV